MSCVDCKAPKPAIFVAFSEILPLTCVNALKASIVLLLIVRLSLIWVTALKPINDSKLYKPLI